MSLFSAMFVKFKMSEGQKSFSRYLAQFRYLLTWSVRLQRSNAVRALFLASTNSFFKVPLQVVFRSARFSFSSLWRAQGGAHDSNSARYLFRVPMIHRFMTSHPVAELLLCFRAKHQDGRPMPFGFLVILTHRLTELCILNAENLEKVSSRPFKQIS